jgi:hypothetical protein
MTGKMQWVFWGEVTKRNGDIEDIPRESLAMTLAEAESFARERLKEHLAKRGVRMVMVWAQSPTGGLSNILLIESR